ncbi:MAG: efflux RND transporter permease subunit [Deltaproteobacteria bacterium]|nr:efflux RND transporter permease subunit [Deltaproteobacteria bacterium]
MFSQIFINRPRLAAVISIVITVAGLIALVNIPVARYPHITPPIIRVTAFYPGANAKVLADTVAAPIEKAVNGVDNMLYMESSCSDVGIYNLSVTFAVGTDPDIDQVNLQNRIQLATPKLPREVVNQGIGIRKRSVDMMAIIAYYSPDKSRDMLFLSNFVSNEIKDELVRLPGISDGVIFGEKEYSVRIWMNPDRLAALGLTADDVIGAIRAQNIQAAVGGIGQEPTSRGQQVQYILQAKGRLSKVEDFANIIIRVNDQGGLVRVGDIARVELAARSYGHIDTLNGGDAAILALYRSTGANAMDTMREVNAKLKELSARLPAGVEYKVILDTTRYVSTAIHEIVVTLVMTFLLVLFVNYIFLQDWRATLVPTVTIPVSLIGTFAVLLALGYNANTISLFALIMAIGVVVDDAIVVVENVYRLMSEEKIGGREAAIRAMRQVTGPIIATTLVLLAVFVPVGFIPGITGQLYRQFAVTICTAVLISTLNALTLSPALCAVLLKEVRPPRRGPLAWFNRGLDLSRRGYIAGCSWLIRRLVISLLLLVGVYASTWMFFSRMPTSFLPREDQGYFFIDLQLPESASLQRTAEVLRGLGDEIGRLDGVQDFIGVCGFSLLSGDADNVAFGVAILKPWDQRRQASLQLDAILRQAQIRMAGLTTANCFAFAPPPISGLGSSGGFDFRLLDLEGGDPGKLYGLSLSLMLAARKDPVLSRVFTTYTANTPHLFLDIDRTRAESLRVPIKRIFATLQAQLGSAYVNDFNLKDRTYQVIIQAQSRYRDAMDDIRRLYVRSDSGAMIPLESLLTLKTVIGPQLIKRYNQYRSARFSGRAAPGYSSGEAMAAMAKLAQKILPPGYAYDWSSISFQERRAQGQILWIFGLALLFGYLFLVGQYESWNIPLAIIFSIPVATLGALLGLWVMHLPLSIYAQIGLVLLVGLAAKNAILIVEFSRERRDDGLGVFEAAIDGAKIRFRPVLMTAFTFILGVAPMILATGAGAGSRRAIGTTVFFGMLVITVFGIFLIPVLYYIFQSAREKGTAWRRGEHKKLQKRKPDMDDSRPGNGESDDAGRD